MNRLILVAEDDALNAKLIIDVLTFKGYPVVQAANGGEAVEMVLQKKPALILMDMQMPVMDGFAVVRRLKNDPATAAIPIWALTSYAMPGDEERIRKAGCDLYIGKPLDVRDFVERVNAYFDGSGAAPAPAPANPDAAGGETA